MVSFSKHYQYHQIGTPPPAVSRFSLSYFFSSRFLYFSYFMLPCTSPKEAVLACPPSPPWNLSSFTVEFTLSSPCSRSDRPLTRQGVVLAHLDSLSPHDLVFGQTALFLLFLAKETDVLDHCSLCWTEATLSVSACPVCSSFSAEACAILHVLCWSGKYLQSTTSLLLPSDSRSVLTTLFSPPSFLLSPALWQIWQKLSSLFSCSIRLQCWPDGVGYSCLPQSLVVFLLLSLVCFLVLSRTGSVLFDLNSLTHRFPRFPPRNLCFLVMLAVSSLVYAATDTAFF